MDRLLPVSSGLIITTSEVAILNYCFRSKSDPTSGRGRSSSPSLSPSPQPSPPPPLGGMSTPADKKSRKILE